MWICKECGGTEFEEERIVRNKISSYEVSPRGLVKVDACNEKVSDVRTKIYCTCCHNDKSGSFLSYIAEWVEDDEEA